MAKIIRRNRAGLIHCSTKPAMIDNGVRYWYRMGHLHRPKGPAVEDLKSGLMKWYRYGRLHREDGPALIFNDIEEYRLYGIPLSKSKHAFLLKYRDKGIRFFVPDEPHKIATYVILDEKLKVEYQLKFG